MELFKGRDAVRLTTASEELGLPQYVIGLDGKGFALRAPFLKSGQADLEMTGLFTEFCNAMQLISHPYISTNPPDRIKLDALAKAGLIAAKMVQIDNSSEFWLPHNMTFINCGYTAEWTQITSVGPFRANMWFPPRIDQLPENGIFKLRIMLGNKRKFYQLESRFEIEDSQ